MGRGFASTDKEYAFENRGPKGNHHKELPSSKGMGHQGISSTCASSLENHH